MKIILASSSIFRKNLLSKLDIKFTVCAPNIDETQIDGETPYNLVCRLSKQKAQQVAKTNSGIIIASDQIAVIDGDILGKPLTHKNAVKQLQKCSGKKVNFLTSLCVLNNDIIDIVVEEYNVYFRNLDDKKINNYLHKEQPYNCAGAFKSEGLGIALFEKLVGDDPNSLIGLPLIKLVTLLKKHNIEIL